jgi:hypothetical protein
MSGEKSIAKLLSAMSPTLNDGDYVFCCVTDPDLVKDEEILGSFREKEGLTVIIERNRAKALGLDFEYVAAWITLTVHSALDAVGLTAAIFSWGGKMHSGRLRLWKRLLGQGVESDIG